MQSKIVCVLLFLFQGSILCNGQKEILNNPDCMEHNSLILGKLIVEEFGETFVDSMLLNRITIGYYITIDANGKAIGIMASRLRNYDEKLLANLTEKVIGQRFYYCSNGFYNSPIEYRELQKEFMRKKIWTPAAFPRLLEDSYRNYKYDIKRAGKGKILPFPAYIKKRVREYKPSFK